MVSTDSTERSILSRDCLLCLMRGLQAETLNICRVSSHRRSSISRRSLKPVFHDAKSRSPCAAIQVDSTVVAQHKTRIGRSPEFQCATIIQGQVPPALRMSPLKRGR